jgi:hypothetical protein
MVVRALVVLCLMATTAAAELPTIDTEHPPTMRIESAAWGVKLERVAVAIHSAPEVTFVTIAVTGRDREVELPIDVPIGTKIIGLGADAPEGRVWGRPMRVESARERQANNGGAVLRWRSASADHDHMTIRVNVPATVELALLFPPLARLAIAADAGVLSVEVEGVKLANKHKRVVVELADVAGTSGEVEHAYVTEDVGLVAAPTPPTAFFEAVANFGHRPFRDLDKAMIRRRMKWFQPGLRECFMRTARSSTLRSGGAIVSFSIADGRVEWATTRESDLPDAVNACLVEQVEQWEFPAADGSVVVNYPVTFHANE